MKKLMVLFIAISFCAALTLVACGPKEEAPAPTTEQAQPAPAAPAAPAPEAAPAAPAAPATEQAPAAPAAPAPGK
jgi:hypothetical protein